MVSYSDRKGLGNPNFMNDEYKKEIIEFSKKIPFDHAWVWFRSDPWHQPKDKKEEKYIYIWANKDVFYVGQSFNVAKRIYDELYECHRQLNKRQKYLYQNGYWRNPDKFLQDFDFMWYGFEGTVIDDMEQLYIKSMIERFGKEKCLNKEAYSEV